MPKITGRIVNVLPSFTVGSGSGAIVTVQANDGHDYARRVSPRAEFNPEDYHYSGTDHTYPVTASKRLQDPAHCNADTCPARYL